MPTFSNKVALVTGGTSGIGRETALAFSREGARVVVAGRREKEGAETVRLLLNNGTDAIFVRTDVSNENQVKSLVEQTVAKFGRLDYAFNYGKGCSRDSRSKYGIGSPNGLSWVTSFIFAIRCLE
jgi:NAD(P)-dependent dehydrogenase (short-subunit alcohol dehydrogenase family)